jgi:hypothetical protein
MVTGYCNGCKSRHKLEYGKVQNKETGEYEESTLLGYVKCPENGNAYLATINGEEIFPNKPDNVVFMSEDEL